MYSNTENDTFVLEPIVNTTIHTPITPRSGSVNLRTHRVTYLVVLIELSGERLLPHSTTLEGRGTVRDNKSLTHPN